ncbi:MAG: hypothetical protein ACOCQR_03770 [bacterium]
MRRDYDKNEFYKEIPREENPILYQRNIAFDNAMKEKLKAGVWHVFALLSWLIASHFLPRMIMIMGAIMWAATGIAVYFIANDRPSIIRRSHQSLLTYSWGLLGYRFMINLLMNVPMEDWSRAMQIQIPDAFASTMAQWFLLVFTIFTFMFPAGYLGYLGQKFFVFRSHREVGQRRKDIMRTGGQDPH